MATFDVLQFRVHSVRCIRPTRHSPLESDPDSIDLAAVVIDENGEADGSRTFLVHDRFSAGVQKDFSPPLVVYQFDLNEASFWPRTYFSILTLAERDDWGRIDDWVVSAVRQVSTAVSSLLGRLTSREVGRALRSEEVGGLAGNAVTAVVQALLESVFSALDTDVLTPTRVELELASPDFTFSGATDGPVRSVILQGHDGEYLVTHSWARRSLETEVSDDPEVSELEVIITTGGDDLRGESLALLDVTFTSGETVAGLPLNRGAGWANDSTHTVRVSLPRPRRVSEFARIGVTHRSVVRGFPHFDTPDNWNMNSIVVRYLSSSGNGLLLARSGRPLRRFENGGRWLEEVRTVRPRDSAITLQTHDGHFLMAMNGGGAEVLARATEAREWETFQLVQLADGRVALRTVNGQFVTAEGGGGRGLVATANAIGPWQTFDLLIQNGDRVALRAHNGQHVVAEGGGGREVLVNRRDIREWETFRIRPR